MHMKLKDGKCKVLTFSYDDCVVQDIRLIKLFNQYGLKGTFNINTGLYAPEDKIRERFRGRMKQSEAKETYIGSGHEVAAHGLKHLTLAKTKSDEALADVLDDRRNIELQYKTVARGMAYANGSFNDEVIDLLDKCGICYCRTTKSTESFGFPNRWLELNPTCHHNNPRLMELAERFVTETPKNFLRDNWMFYVWGHAYEFDNNDNWDVIENFAEYVGNKEDIWYATNIEIFDYVKAYENLQTSVDKKIVYNPSAIDVWFSQDNEVHCVKSGQTLYL